MNNNTTASAESVISDHHESQESVLIPIDRNIGAEPAPTRYVITGTKTETQQIITNTALEAGEQAGELASMGYAVSVERV